ncbi:LPXTG cell wall anchor domain-containing protein [Candidatus Saccharibacteria bacterium]|nr:MAG: LPXTG cell wall anchor domain-containing protein [Candidatus Saccharibacteria bacterium]
MTDAEKASCPVATVKLCGSFVGYPAGSEWYAIAVYQGEEFLTFGWNPVADGISLELPSQGLYGVTLVVRGPDGTELSRTEYGPDNPLPSECVVYTFTPEKVAIPTQPASTDRCNPAGGAVVPPVWDATTDTDKYTWSVNDKGQKVATLRDTVRTTWSDGTTAPKVFTLPADNGVVCQVPNKDLAPLIVTKTCGGVVKVANPAANPSVLVLWGDDLVNTENISGQFTVAPGATEQFTTTYAMVDLSFGPTVAGFEPYLQANFATDQSECPVTPPMPPNPGPKTVLVSSDVANSVSCTEGTKLVETSTYSVPQVLADSKYTNDPNRAHWILVGEPTVKSVKLDAAELATCQQLPNTGSDISLPLWISLGLMALGAGLLLANRRLRRVEG